MAAQAHRDMIRLLRERNPRVVVAIGLPFQDWKPFPEMREAYRKLAAELNTPESPVLAVDHSGGWIAKPTQPNADTVDWVHPSANGDRKIAARWFEALKPILQRSSSIPSR
jgi:lysophospholipase L1-like esterase